MKFLAFLAVIAVVGAIIGFLTSDDDEKGEGALTGAAAGVGYSIGCLMQLIIPAIVVLIGLWLLGVLF